MSKIYIADVEVIKAMFADRLGTHPRAWKCQCGVHACPAWVVHATVDGRRYFIANQTFQAKPPYLTIVIDNVEDIGLLMASDVLPHGDHAMYTAWFKMGLKEALFAD